MTMLRSAFRKELLELRRDGRFRILAVVASCLILSSILLSYRDFAETLTERRSGQTRSRSQWIEQGTKNPHAAAHYGVHVFRQPGPLALFDRGLLPFTGAAIFLEAHKQNLPVHAPAQDGTLARRLGEWTPANVIQTLGPLIVILVLFGSVAHERERGSLLMLRSLGVSLRTVAWSKLLSASFGLAAVLVPAALGSLLLASFHGLISGDLLLRVFGLALAYTLYLGCFLLLCLTASMHAKTARGALVLLLGLWVAWVIVVPRALTNAVGDAYPLPRWGEVEQHMAQEQGLVADSADPYERRIEALRRDTLAQHGVDDPSKLPVNFGGVMLIAGERWGDAVFDRRFGELYQTYRAQDGMLRRAGWLAPVLALRAISMDLAGTGIEDEVAFRRAAEAYRRELVYRMNKAVHDHPEEGFTADVSLWRGVPSFHYAAPGALALLRQHALDFCALGAWLSIGLLATIWAARRLDREALR
jgi:ABC-2 type transport system permease protein